MAVTEKTKIGTIDLTPTWSGFLPTLLALYEDGDVDGRNAAFEELQKMARIADMLVADQKGA